MPRDLPISRDERRALRARVSAARGTRLRPRTHVASFVPAGVMALTMLVWMPILWGVGSRAGIIAAIACLIIQLLVTRPLMQHILWPDTCIAMAAAGYEVCPRCAFPLRDLPASELICTECGTARVTVPPEAASES